MNDRIKRIRAEFAVTQQELANILDKSLTSVQFWERGTNKPSKATLRDISEKFGVNIAWLLTGEGEMFPVKEKDMTIIGNGNVQATGIGHKIINGREYKNISPELLDLLENYATPSFLSEIQERLLNIKKAQSGG